MSLSTELNEAALDNADEESSESIMGTEEVSLPMEGKSSVFPDTPSDPDSSLIAIEQVNLSTNDLDNDPEMSTGCTEREPEMTPSIEANVGDYGDDPESAVESSITQDNIQPEQSLLTSHIEPSNELFEEIEQDEFNENESEMIGIDQEDCNDSNDAYLYQEIEIKEEEELDLDPDDDPEIPLDDDPIADMSFSAKEDHETDEGVIESEGNFNPGELSTSATDTADEDENFDTSTPIGEHAYHAKSTLKSMPEKRVLLSNPIEKVRTPIQTFSSPHMPQNVRGYLLTKNSMHQCLECYGKFFSMAAFIRHRKRHPKQPDLPYQCQYCTTRFRLHSDMVPHLLTHTKLESLSCPICPTHVHSALGLVNHLQEHKNPAENFYFKCVTCAVRFSSCKQLHEHNLMSHPKHKTVKKQLSRTVHVCFHCGKVENTWPGLVIHMRTHKGPLSCTLCRLSMQTSDGFAQHVVSVHKDKGKLTYYRCRNPFCPREFVSTLDLEQHEKTCLPVGGEYRCEICEQLYRELDHFITHMQLHSMLSNENGPKMCPHCIWTSDNPAKYAEHLVKIHGYRDRIETIEKTYESEINFDNNIASTTAEEDQDKTDKSNQIDDNVRQKRKKRKS